MRVLADIASYDIGKPVWVSEAALHAAERWLGEPDAHTYAHSPLDVIDPLLAKGGASTTSERIKLVFHPFAVSRENTWHIRERAVAIILELAHAADPRRAIRALSSVETALHEPMGEFGREVSEDEKLAWEDDSLALLDGISDLTDAVPLVALQLRDLLRWHCTHATSTAVRERAEEIRSRTELNFERNIMFLITKPWSFDKLDHFEADGLDYEARHESAAIAGRELAKELLSRYSEPRDGLEFLLSCINDVEAVGQRVEPGQLLFRISDVDAAYGERLAALIVDSEISSLAGSSHALLPSVRKANPEQALAIAERALASPDPAIRAVVGNALAGGWSEVLTEEDEGLLERVLKDQNLNVRLSGLHALRRLAMITPHTVARLCRSVDLASNGTLAEEFFGIFGEPYGLPLDVFDDGQLDELIVKAEGIPSLDGYQTQEFLASVGARRSQSVVQLVLNRLTQREAKDYQPIPYHFHVDLAPLRSSPDYTNTLRAVRDKALGATGSLAWWVPRAFSMMAGDFTDANVQLVLDEWIAEGDGERIEAVGLLLSDAPNTFALDHPEFVARLLNAAREVSNECLRHTGGHLAGGAISGSGSRAIGSPSAGDVSRRDRAAELAARFPTGSPARRFYEDLVRYSERSIADTLARDEEYLSGEDD